MLRVCKEDFKLLRPKALARVDFPPRVVLHANMIYRLAIRFGFIAAVIKIFVQKDFHKHTQKPNRAIKDSTDGEIARP